jgi:RNA polymerase sigma-70 factor (ECF subfamily)
MSDLARLLEAYFPRLRRYAFGLTRRHHEVDDLVQDCLARALENQHLFTPDTDLGSWLITLMHNLYVTNVRRAVRGGVSVSVDEVAWKLEATADPTAPLQLKQLARAIAALPFEQQQAILLIGVEGMKYDEVAEMLGVPCGTVRSRLSRGRVALRRAMGMEEENPRARSRSEPSPVYEAHSAAE